MNLEVEKDGTYSDYTISVTVDSELSYVVFNAYKWTNVPYGLRFYGTTGVPDNTLDVVYPFELSILSIVG